MPIYRTLFERFNFNFDPSVKQTADVVFECDAPNDEEHYQKLSGAAWEAMWEQNPHWHEPKFHLEGFGGWSSVIGGHKFEQVIDIDLHFDLGTLGDSPIPRIAEIIEVTDWGERRTYRVTGYYKAWVYPEPKSDAEKMTQRLIQEILDEDPPEEKARRATQLKVITCSRDEAEFVSGSGTAGTIRRIGDVKVIGRVKWDDRTIARARRDYDRSLERDRDDRPTEMFKYWEDPRYLAKIAQKESVS